MCLICLRLSNDRPFEIAPAQAIRDSRRRARRSRRPSPASATGDALSGFREVDERARAPLRSGDLVAGDGGATECKREDLHGADYCSKGLRLATTRPKATPTPSVNASGPGYRAQSAIITTGFPRPCEIAGITPKATPGTTHSASGIRSTIQRRTTNPTGMPANTNGGKKAPRWIVASWCAARIVGLSGGIAGDDGNAMT
jgi:hypothetical protein